MNFNWINNKHDYLIYVGDAMCSWCHGFAPQLDKVLKEYPDLDFKLVMGGLRPYYTKKAYEMADFLKTHWIEIQEKTNQPFSFEILKDKNFIYDTEPSSRAIIVARTMDPLIEYDFFKAVQMAFYRDNKDTNSLDTYLSIAASFDLELNAFERLFNSEEVKTRTKADFHLTKQFGIQGFPSLLLKKNNSFTLLCNGYSPADTIHKILKEVL